MILLFQQDETILLNIRVVKSEIGAGFYTEHTQSGEIMLKVYLEEIMHEDIFAEVPIATQLPYPIY